MKRFNILVALLVFIFNCNGQESKKEANITSNANVGLKIFGKGFNPNKAISNKKMHEKYGNMAVADTVETQFIARVTNVCQAKGCWMKLKLHDGQEAMVRFKDYGFFVPKDIANKEVIVSGLAFVEEMSVEDQKHYAGDAGKSEEEIIKIVKPIKTYGFLADGVLLKE